MQTFNDPIPLSLYIHIPWCVRKCPYCDFNSHELTQDFQEKAYIKALLNDLEEQLPKIQRRHFHSIFFGGGTPSLFSPEGIEQLLLGIRERHLYSSDIEITLEANPGTIDEGRFQGFREAGVNRLSIGVQSFQNDKLQKLGRIHDHSHACRAIESAKHAGFTNFNLDLMHGLPNQSIDDALEDLTTGIQFQPTHLSWYQLTLEPNTVFHKYPPLLPPDDTLWTIQEEGKKLLNAHGFKQYEVSAYSQPEYQCQHNLNYWQFGDYLGIGAGAHSKITSFDRGLVTRHWQMKMPKDYMNPEKKFIAHESIVSSDDLIFEFMLNALRLNDGVPINLFTQRTGLSSEIIKSLLKKAKKQGLLENLDEKIKPTEQGQLFLNDLTALFLPS